jgi:hypothetical protein
VPVESNMSFKPVVDTPSDAPLQVSFANGFAILSQTKPYASRRLTKCYISERNFVVAALIV